MISFKYNEIPDGKSRKSIEVKPSVLALEGLDVKSVHVDVNFNKSERSTMVDFEVQAGIRFICDRSLEEFEQVLSGSYSVVFKPGFSDEEQDDDDSLKSLKTEGEKLDITNEVRDTILLNVPIKKLHPKFITEDGEPTEFSETYSDGVENDPRWDALKKLKNN